MHIFVIILFLFLNVTIFAQEIIPEISFDDIPNGIITRNEVIPQNALWGYINGGADIFIEYGFDAVRVQEIIWNKFIFKIDIYSMSDEEAAFGIYSVSHRSCKNTEYLADYQCATKHQLQLVKGKFYISIINTNGTAEEQSFSRSLATKLLNKIQHYRKIKLPDVLQQDVFLNYHNNIIFAKGELGLQNSFPDWIGLADEIIVNSIYILPIRIEKGDLIITAMRFNTEKDLEEFCKRVETRRIKNKIRSGLIKQANNEIIYYESTLEFKYSEKLINAIESAKPKQKPCGE